jgi:ubiquinone/menaquinone biosynthesis C-methylase UbiE
VKIDNYVWDKIAELPLSYHSVGREMPQEHFVTVADHICKILEIYADHNVADIGCASGMITKFIAKKAKSCVGIDLSIPLIKVANNHNLHDNICYCVGETAKIPLKDNWADKVNCYGVFLLLPNHNYVLESVKELSRICKPEGRILIGDITDIKKKRRYTWDRLTTRRKVRKLLGLLVPTEHKLWVRRNIFRQKIEEASSQPWLWFDMDHLRDNIERLGLSCQYTDQPSDLVAGYYRSNVIIRNTK